MSELPSIDGVTITMLREIRDHRGAVLHFIRRDAPDFTGFGEAYFSEVRPGVIKAWKRHRIQAQNLAAPVGRAKLVIFDERQQSASHGAIQVIELGRPDAYTRVHIPPGLWYGFQCISPESLLLANCADIPHEPEEAETMPLDAPRIPYSWKP